MQHVGVFREGLTLQTALDSVRDLKERYARISIEDKGAKFNTDLYEAWELGCLLDLAEVTTFAALDRTESRGAHYREDYPKRDDANWMKHSFVTCKNGVLEVAYKPVIITRFEPTERKY